MTITFRLDLFCISPSHNIVISFIFVDWSQFIFVIVLVVIVDILFNFYQDQQDGECVLVWLWLSASWLSSLFTHLFKSRNIFKCSLSTKTWRCSSSLYSQFLTSEINYKESKCTICFYWVDVCEKKSVNMKTLLFHFCHHFNVSVVVMQLDVMFVLPPEQSSLIWNCSQWGLNYLKLYSLMHSVALAVHQY